jgi:hypothetical protein
MECSEHGMLRKTIGNKLSQPSKEAMCVTADMLLGQGCPSPLEFTSCHHVSQMLDVNLMFSFLGFSHALVPFLFFYAPITPF